MEKWHLRPHKENMRRLPRYTRWLYELLFSVYCAALVVFWGNEHGYWDRLQVPLLALDRGLLPLLHRTIFTRNAFHAFYGELFYVTVIAFLCVWVLERIALTRMFLRIVTAVVPVAGPLASDVFESAHMVGGDYFRTSEGHLAVARWLQWLEVTVVVGCILLFLFRRWPANASLGILVLLLHFGFWGSIIFGQDWRDYLWQFAALVVLPFCTGLAWGLCVRLPAGSQTRAEAP